MPKQEYISDVLQRELDDRIRAAGGDVAKVRKEVEAEVNALEQETPEGDQSKYQVQVALLRGELLYLDSLLHAEDGNGNHAAPSFWQRIGNLFRGNQATA